VKSNKWLILLPVFLILILLGLDFYFFLYSPKKPKPLTDSLQSNKEELSSLLIKKPELPQEKEEVSLVAVGDISYSRGVERVIKKQKDINYPFLKIQDYLKDADLVFGNLETPITSGREILDGEMIFRSNPGTEQALKKANFSVLSLANNHTPNFGEEGLKDTFTYLQNAGIKYVGAGKNEEEAYRPVYIEKKGIKFAFLAYSDAGLVPTSYEAGNNHAGTAFMQLDKMTKAIKEAGQKADFIIVSMHAGTEYTDEPNSLQINFAHLAINSGADLVIGHHPHTVQTMEKYKDKYIFYSLGNFVFDQMWSLETREGLILKIYFKKDGTDNIFFFPVNMKNLAQPEIVDDKTAEKILEKLKFPLKNQCTQTSTEECKGEIPIAPM